jgi:hypothetical protein
MGVPSMVEERKRLKWLMAVGPAPFLVAHHVAELHQGARVAAHVEAVQVSRGQARGPFQLGDHVVFLAAHLDLAQVQPAEQHLQGAGDGFHRDAQGGRAVAVNVDAQFRLGHFVAGTHVGQQADGAQLVGDGLRHLIQGVQIRFLQHELEGLAEPAADRLGNDGEGQGALHGTDHLGPQSVRSAHHIADPAFALFVQLDKHEAFVDRARSLAAEGDGGEIAVHLRCFAHDGFHPLHHAVGVFAGGPFGGDHEGEQASLVLLGQELLVQPGIDPG